MTPNWHFDLLAPFYDGLIRAPDAQTLKRILDLPSPGWMLDAAGGTGRVAAQLSPLVGRLVISDLSLPMLRAAAAKEALRTEASAKEAFRTEATAKDTLRKDTLRKDALRMDALRKDAIRMGAAAPEDGRRVDRLALAPVQARVERLPFADGCFARVLVVDAFHHFADQPGALADLARVLQPGGRLVIEEPDIRRGAVKLIALGETLLGMGSHFRTLEVMQSLLAQTGLQVTVESADATVWVVGRKPLDASRA